jgi:hypothetical protein
MKLMKANQPTNVLCELGKTGIRLTAGYGHDMTPASCRSPTPIRAQA